MKYYELENGDCCDEHYLLIEYLNATEQIKEYELFKSALIKRRIELLR